MTFAALGEILPNPDCLVKLGLGSPAAGWGHLLSPDRQRAAADSTRPAPFPGSLSARTAVLPPLK